MDTLDLLLLDAWNRLGAHCKRDRLVALKRSQRRFQKMIQRPMRECCLVIRASDTRINRDNGSGVFDEQVAARQPHWLWLEGSLIRELTKPVIIDWPGVTMAEAARMLGREYPSLHEWVRQGVFRIERYREFGFPEGGQKPGRKPIKDRLCDDAAAEPLDHVDHVDHAGDPDHVRCGDAAEQVDRADRVRCLDATRTLNTAQPKDAGQGVDLWAERFTGGGRPYVWSPSPIDPNSPHGRAPHPVWGTLWQSMWQCLPEDFAMEVKRVPRFRTQRDGRRQFFGWEFVCPGRLDERGEPRGCGRHCTYLYGPQTVWTLAKAIGEVGLEMPVACGLAGQWYPGLADLVAAQGTRTFACHACWGIRRASMADSDGWNDFITSISGGLLYGKDVPRPKDICPIEPPRYRQKKKRKPRQRVVVETVGEKPAAAG